MYADTSIANLKCHIVTSKKVNGPSILEILSQSMLDSSEKEQKLRNLIGGDNQLQDDFIKIISIVGNHYLKERKYDTVFVLGGPGSGKGTNCSKIVADFNYVHLSAGDLLRAERESASSLADLINVYIKEGSFATMFKFLNYFYFDRKNRPGRNYGWIIEGCDGKE